MGEDFQKSVENKYIHHSSRNAGDVLGTNLLSPSTTSLAPAALVNVGGNSWTDAIKSRIPIRKKT